MDINFRVVKCLNDVLLKKAKAHNDSNHASDENPPLVITSEKGAFFVYQTDTPQHESMHSVAAALGGHLKLGEGTTPVITFGITDVPASDIGRALAERVEKMEEPQTYVERLKTLQNRGFSPHSLTASAGRT